MTWFAVIAFVMVTAACGLLVAPLLRARTVTASSAADSPPAPLSLPSALVVLISVPAVTLALYFTVSDGVPNPAELTGAAQNDTTPSVAEMVASLEQRLRDNPDDAEGWQMLARSYVVMGRFTDGVAVYQRLVDGGRDNPPGLLVDYAEALIMVDQASLSGRAGALLEEALVTAPRSRKGLWYGGAAAFERGEFALARDRWQTLANDAPAEIAAALAERIEAAGAMVDGGTTQAPAGTAPAVPAKPGVAAAEPGAAVEVTVSIAPELADRVAPDSPLFVLARAAAGGPPVAVVRRTAAGLPLTVTLGDDNAMMAGRTLSAQRQVQIVARIALGGTPVASPGDLFGSVDYNVGSTQSVQIVIDRVQP